MFPSPSHPQTHHPSTSHMHHQPRQSKQLDTQDHSLLQSQAPPPSRIRTQPTATRRSLTGGNAPPRTAHRQSDSNDGTVGGSTPSCANCATQTTPLWRRNQSGQTLCNACALFQKMKGRPRPMSLKTNVIKPRNRIKAIDRIPLAPSSSHNQQQHLLTARNNSSLVNFNLQQAHPPLVHANHKNQNYPLITNSRNIKSPVAGTSTSSLAPHSFRSNPIAPHLCSPAFSSPSQYHTPTSQTHFLDPHRLSPSPNNPINPSSSQSSSSSQNSFFSTRSAPQAQSDSVHVVRSGINSRKSSPGGVEQFNNRHVHIATSFAHEAKRMKYLSDDLLNKTNLYERRISTGSIEPPHQRHHLPLRASSHARIPSAVYHELSDHRTGPSNDLSDQFHSDAASPSNLDHYSCVDDNFQNPPPQLVSTLSSGQQTPASIDCGSVVEEKEQGHLMDASLSCQSRGRSTLRPSRFTLPPLSQITKDLPAFPLKPNPINLGPPLSFEASAREARLNSPNSSQHLLTIPSSSHHKKFEKRRAVSVISSSSDSESVLSPAHTASSGSRIHSPLDRSQFPRNSGSPITPPVNSEGLICKPHDHSKTYFNQYQSGHAKSSYDSGSQSEMEQLNLDVPKQADSTCHSSEENELPTEELNRLKNRIVQLELINGVMENRISELENTHPDRASKGSLSETSNERSSSRPTHQTRNNSFRTIDDEDRSPSDHAGWSEGNALDDEQLEHAGDELDDEEDQEDQIKAVNDIRAEAHLHV